MNTISVEHRKHLAIVTLDRPSARNAISGEMLDELAQVGVDLLNDLALRAVILTGSGDRAPAGSPNRRRRRSTGLASASSWRFR